MTTTPFLGCKISLISKSEIRYEGILYTIDPKESTIALAKVRSYGTEDRSAERQVPPREEIFEYIIFRAGDIKDLIVDDPPASIAPGLADPAIIQAHSTSTSSGATFPSTTFPQMTTSSSISATPGQRSAQPAFNSANSALNALTSNLVKTSSSVESRSQNSTPTGQQQHRHSPHLDGQTQPSGTKQTPFKDVQNQRRNERTGNERSGQQHQQQQHQQHQRRAGFTGGQHQHQQQNYHNYQNRRGSGQQQHSQQQHYRQNQSHPSLGQNQNQHQYRSEQSGNRFGGQGSYNRQFNNYSSGRRPMQSRPQQQRPPQNRIPNRVPKEPLKFDADFDFDKAEQEFKELEDKMTNIKLEVNSNGEPPKEEEKSTVDTNPINNDDSTNGEKEGLDPNLTYDKRKSFFDSISCEALERERGNVQRIDWKAERKLNTETFGVPLSYRRMGGYGRGRGGYNRGYSGGYRSNRGGGSFSRPGGGGGGGGGGDTRRYNGPQRNRNNN